MDTEILYEFGEYMKTIKYNISKHRFMHYIECFLTEKELKKQWLNNLKSITVKEFIEYFTNIASVRLLNILSKVEKIYLNDIKPQDFYKIRNAGRVTYLEFEKLKRELNRDIIKTKSN